jgi:hypothetical protein
MRAAQVAEAQAGRFEGRRATEREGRATQLEDETRLEATQAGQLDSKQPIQSEASQAGPLTRLFRWWLEYSLRFAEVVGAQWR